MRLKDSKKYCKVGEPKNNVHLLIIIQKMITFVAKLIHSFAATCQNVILLASYTGQCIVSILTWVSTFLIGILRNIILFFRILYEDNVSTFTEEIPASANGIFNILSTQVTNVQSGVVEAFSDICTRLYAILASLKWLFEAVIVVVSEVLCLFKNTIVLLGDTVWLMVIFIPVQLPLLFRELFKYIGCVIVDAYMTLLRFTNYLTEVPLQSFMGITFTMVFVRLCIHFRETILSQITLLYWSLIRNILYMYYVVLDYFTNSENSAIRAVAEDIGTREDFVPAEDDATNAADSLCVICQEHQKCVLTLPCRHVCLCADCCRRLYGYQRTCPICRTFIYHSVTVYL